MYLGNGENGGIFGIIGMFFLKFLWGGVDFLGNLGVLYNYCESIVSKVCNNGGDCLTGGGCRAGGSDTKTNIDSED